ncbi:GNAT family N-acetyltransferase [Silvimonas iriomotensis]|uniref:N-acetyltransferase domain-containing protein n=1 Tax=Silvimonas iriomotensis TaxID=449662 RepID=A0ABQ2P876_9NEIS|nr:GNAT family N-acetyltransferase [Silvimonas iriomotensis]GGP20488.1 hypothetical protein GCM10010970_15460 [Silvimonas iriomotensis]
MATLVPLQTRRLNRHHAADVAALQAILEAAPGYALLVQGQLPQREAAAEDLAALPPGIGHDDKFVWLLLHGDQAVGAIDLIRGYPQPDCAWLGLLLLIESHQRQGLGAAALALVLAEAHRWGCTEMRLGVVACNVVALRFWQQHGFAEIERKQVDGYTDEVIVMRRVL